jgi:molecular chaperone GrpE
VSEEKVTERPQEEVAVNEGEGAEAAEAAVSQESGQSVEIEASDPEQELAEAKEEIAQLRDKMLRMAAENENFKKRMERERQLSLKYAGEVILREMLSVVDNLERAVSLGDADGITAEQNLQALLEGVQLTLKSLLTTLEKFEVKPITGIGEPFDPQHQEALTMEQSDDIPANHVISEFEKGYYYKDRLLRPAKVIVSAGKTQS